MELGFHTIHFSPMFGGEGPVLEVIEATGVAGFDAIGVDLASVETHVAGGGSIAEVKTAIGEAGLRCSDVLVLVAGADDALLATARTLGELAEALGAPSCIAAMGAPLPWSELVGALRECAGVLADHGCRMAIEFTPYTPLATLPQAVDLCAAVGWDRAGLVLDALHFFRSGSPWPALEALTADQVAVVQWSDAPVPPPASLVEESRNHRLLPGEGGLPLPALAEAIRSLGYDGVVSAEVLSEAMRRSEPRAAIADSYVALASAASGWLTAAAG